MPMAEEECEPYIGKFMHEFGIVTNILKIIEKAAKANDISQVSSIALSIGKLRQIDIETLGFAFETAAKGSVAENATLEITEVPITMECDVCHYHFEIAEQHFICPQCQGTSLTILTGKEISINHITG